MRNINPTHTQNWKALKEHHKILSAKNLSDMFLDDPDRFEKFSIEDDHLLADFSKQFIQSETLELFEAFSQECHLGEAINSYFGGDAINKTENRAVLHTALRNFSDNPVLVNGKDVMPQIRIVLEKMKQFSAQIIGGNWKGFTGKAIKDIVNIGIGGSDLGPKMVYEALKFYRQGNLTAHFVSNVDGTDLAETLKLIDPETTLFIIASKTFGTQETMTNAHSARDWFLKHAEDETHIARHFVAVSTQADKVSAFGIDTANMFEFWDWVGGRYSVWGAIGLPVACTIGYENFEQLLKGAEATDIHFRNKPFAENIPVMMAWIGIWNRNFFKAESYAVLPYEQYLHRFPAYLQQADMESNGKSTDRNGDSISYETGPIVWGEPGTNGQHAFYQLIHQSSSLIPCDFIAFANSHHPLSDHHQKLISNFFAQTEALMNGKSEQEVIEELKKQGLHTSAIYELAPFKVFPGNKPTTSILIDKLSPYNLGRLIALYEHKIFVQGVLWNIYSFDQYGVELGKVLANKILPELAGTDKIESHDSSTNGLIDTYKKWREGES
jgi:glucose-6-phosphate isomerase